MKRRDRRSRRGFSLVEVMLAGGLVALTAVSLFEGIGVCARIAHENAQFLVADAYAHDLAWKRFNENYSALNSVHLGRRNQPIVENIASNAAPALWISGSPAQSRTVFSYPKTASGADDVNGVRVTVDVEWGAAGNRRSLSSAGHVVAVHKSAHGQEDR